MVKGFRGGCPGKRNKEKHLFLLRVIDSECNNYQSIMAYKNVQEKSVEKKVAADWFSKFDCTETVGRIDFGVKTKDS